MLDRGGLGRIRALAGNTFREALRNRAFIALSVVAAALLVFSIVLGELAVVGQRTRIVVGFGFFAISLFLAVTAITMGAVLLHKEVEKKTVYTILSKPVRRFEFILGKYVGMLAILTVELAVLTAVWLLVLWLQGSEFGLEHLKGVLLMGFEMSLVTAVAVMFSAMSSPVVTALLAAGVFGAGRWVYLIDEKLHASRGFFVDNAVGRGFGEAVVAVFPDLQVFNISQRVLLDVQTDWGYLASAGLYAFGYGALFLIVAIVAFERRDFT